MSEIVMDCIMCPNCLGPKRSNPGPLERQLAEAQVENEGLREELKRASQAGTPYWHERDTMNGLILLNQGLVDERDECRRLLREIADGEWGVSDSLKEAAKAAGGDDE